MASEAKKEYLLTEVEFAASEESAHAGGSGGFSYSNSFRCIPSDVDYRAPRVTPRPAPRLHTSERYTEQDKPEIGFRDSRRHDVLLKTVPSQSARRGSTTTN